MKLTRIVLFLFFPSIFIACGTQQKLPNYLENISDTTGKQAIQIPELKIQKSDLLSIQVYSASTRPDMSDAPYNLPPASSSQGNTSGNTVSTQGFLVDNNGNIEYPRIGLIKAEGLTKQQLADVIKRKINERDSVLTNPSVIIRFQNLKITVLGEVKKPGVISFPGERMTILEALGLAGDVDVYGMKDRIKVIRESNGNRETGLIDLSAKELFDSPYYNLMQNDVVVVEPAKSKAKKADQDVTLRQAGFLISVITAVAVIVRVFQ